MEDWQFRHELIVQYREKKISRQEFIAGWKVLEMKLLEQEVKLRRETDRKSSGFFSLRNENRVCLIAAEKKIKELWYEV